MAIDDRVGKADLFKIVVGKARFGGHSPGDVPDFKIKPNNVDEVYLAVKKMQRCYHADQTYPVAKYYASSFGEIENAYLSGNFNDFQEAVRGLMVAIHAE